MNICDNNKTLKLVHVVLRHGHRTQDRSFTYPKDPHKSENFYPHGYGQLTNEGKMKSYELGQSLRTKYDDFLGELYLPGTIDGISSDSDRTKATLQLVLAGLFPPKGSQMWNEQLSWQPIPYSYTPISNDKIFFGLLPLQYYMEENLVQRDKSKGCVDLMKYLTECSGMEVNNSADIFFLYCTLSTQEQCGLKLPEWTGKIYPEPLRSSTCDFYQLILANENAKKLATGALLKKIMQDSIDILSGSPTKRNRKMNLYSGHDVNLAFLLITLGLFEPHIPPYLAHLIIEVHTIDGQDGIKILYQNYSSHEPEIFRLPNCEEFCTMKQFMKIVEKYIEQ